MALVVDEAHCIQMWLVKYNYFVLCTCLFVRGDTFRKAFFEIGTLQSLIPKSVNVTALTATATNRTISVVTSHLAMDDPVIIGLNTDRSNIKYVVKPSEPVEQLSTTLADELILARTNIPKTVIFCRSLRECADILRECADLISLLDHSSFTHQTKRSQAQTSGANNFRRSNGQGDFVAATDYGTQHVRCQHCEVRITYWTITLSRVLM